VDNQSVFEINEGDPLGWAYRLANTLHITTRPSFILREILFAEGDCLDPVLLEESARILRAYPFMQAAYVTSTRQPDGSHHVLVVTQDDWTTKVDLGASFDQGFQLERLDLTEENLLGQGILAAAYTRRRKEQRDAGLEFQQPRLFGTRTDATFGIGRTRVGSFFEQSLEYPFVGEVGRFAIREEYRRRDQLFNYATGATGPEAVTNALVPYNVEWGEVSLATRIGRPGNLTMFGLALSREQIRFGGFPGDVEIVRDSDFGTTFDAPVEVRRAVTPQARERTTTRLAAMVGQRNLRFARPSGLDFMTADQDVRLGSDIGVTVGRSVGLFNGSELPSPDDLYGRINLFAGHDPGSSFIFLNAFAEARRVDTDGDAWRDVIAEADLYSYLRTGALEGHTLFVRASGSIGRSLETPFQVTLGGREAVRSLVEEDAPGAARMLFTIEDRIVLKSLSVMDFGLSLFADAGKVWAGDVPYGTDSDWVGAVGFGLRMGFPAGGRGLARLDLAFPVGHEGDPVFRVTMIELTGFLGGFSDDQLDRSRVTRVGPDYFVNESR